MVEVKLASKAATASGDKVCENDSGGNGTLPGAGATNEGYGYVAVVGTFPPPVVTPGIGGVCPPKNGLVAAAATAADPFTAAAAAA